MKVYELMSRLENMPAGAEIEIVGAIARDEFEESGVIESREGEIEHIFRYGLESVELEEYEAGTAVELI